MKWSRCGRSHLLLTTLPVLPQFALLQSALPNGCSRGAAFDASGSAEHEPFARVRESDQDFTRRLELNYGRDIWPSCGLPARARPPVGVLAALRLSGSCRRASPVARCVP